jgi:hypothetical protein
VSPDSSSVEQITPSQRYAYNAIMYRLDLESPDSFFRF